MSGLNGHQHITIVRLLGGLLGCYLVGSLGSHFWFLLFSAIIAGLSDCYGILCGVLCLHFSVKRFKVWQ